MEDWQKLNFKYRAMTVSDRRFGDINHLLFVIAKEVWKKEGKFDGNKPLGKTNWKKNVYSELEKNGFSKEVIDDYVDSIEDHLED